MLCHPENSEINTENRLKRVALLVMPNTGKSTFFNRITGASAFVGNWPGITVSFLQAEVKINGESTEFVDLPGIYDLNGFSDDEQVVRQFLEQFPISLAVLVLNASQLDRQIRLPLQLKALGIPSVVVLNMADEAERFGVRIVPDELACRLAMPVSLMSAKYGRGYFRAYQMISHALENAVPPALGLGTIVLPDIEADTIEPLLQGAVSMPSQTAITITQHLDAVLLHPIWGLPLFFAGMFAVFWLIWQVGLPSQDLMDQITTGLQATVLEPLVSPLPPLLQSFILHGLWGSLATIASFVPLLVLFFMAMSVLEDSGYLSRSAYLMDALMARLGLDGRSFVMQMMGFGCNVPALMGTRVMRSQSLRWLTMLIIPFSLCSARLQVFVFILAAVFPTSQGAIALFSLYLLSFAAAIFTAFCFQGVFKNDEPFVLELPPYRLPTLRQVLLRGWGEVRIFLTRASTFIALGCITIWIITNIPVGSTGLETIGGQIGLFLQPVMRPIGIDPYLTLALMFGIVAKEVVLGSLSVIYALNTDLISQQLSSSLTWTQAYSFCIFCLLYTPCLTTFVTTFNESKSWKFTGFTLVFSLVLAWLCSFIFYQGASVFMAFH
ncbi:MAG: ferrous iron transport protein B [Prochlorotrichaceae cyanobacterium]